MAWTNITNAQLAIGAPVRSIDLLALRDNILAVRDNLNRGQAFFSSGSFIVPAGIATLKVTVGGGGGGGGTDYLSGFSGSAGGNTTFGSYLTGGGGGGSAYNSAGAQGSISGADFGQLATIYRNASNAPLCYGGAGGPVDVTPVPAGGNGGCATKFITGLTEGTVISVTVGAGGAGGNGGSPNPGQAGGAGFCIVEW